MSGTLMDNKPLPPLSSEPEPQAPPVEIAGGQASSPIQIEQGASPPAPVTQHESALRNVFIGPAGIYPGTRWLIYLAIAYLTFQIEGWLVLPLPVSREFLVVARDDRKQHDVGRNLARLRDGAH